MLNNTNYTVLNNVQMDIVQSQELIVLKFLKMQYYKTLLNVLPKVNTYNQKILLYLKSVVCIITLHCEDMIINREEISM